MRFIYGVINVEFIFPHSLRLWYPLLYVFSQRCFALCLQTSMYIAQPINQQVRNFKTCSKCLIIHNRWLSIGDYIAVLLQHRQLLNATKIINIHKCIPSSVFTCEFSHDEHLQDDRCLENICIIFFPRFDRDCHFHFANRVFYAQFHVSGEVD